MRQKWNNVQRRESEAGASVEGLKNCSQCWDHGPSARGVGPGSRVGQSVAICQMRCCFIQGSEDKLVLSSAGFKALGGVCSAGTGQASLMLGPQSPLEAS